MTKRVIIDSGRSLTHIFRKGGPFIKGKGDEYHVQVPLLLDITERTQYDRSKYKPNELMGKR